jgi:hypothetical protein
VIDTGDPTVLSVTSSTVDGAYKAGDVINVTVNFSESVFVTGVPQITLETGTTDVVVDYVGGSGTSSLTFTYTIASGHTSADLDYISTTALSLNGGTIKDAAGNDASLTLAAPGAAGSVGAANAIVVDTTVPTILNVTSAVADGRYRLGASTISITVAFSETVQVTGFPRLRLGVGQETYATYSSGTGSDTLVFDYTIVSGDNTPDLEYVNQSALSLNGGTIRDVALNAALLSLPVVGSAGSLSANKNIIIDTLTPGVVGVVALSADGGYRAGQVITIRVDFSEAVTVVNSPTLTLETGTNDGVALFATGSGTSQLTFEYTVVSGDTTADLEVQSAAALSGVIQDLAGNGAVVTLPFPAMSPVSAIFIDTEAPTVTLSSGVAHGGITNAASIPFSATFSEDVSGFTVGDLIISNGSASNLVALNATQYTFDIVPTSDGPVSVQVVATAALDAAGNGNVQSNGLSFTYDSTRPTVAISSVTSDATNTTPIPITVQFSENVTGLTVNSFNVINGSVANLSGSGMLFSLDVIPDGEGVITVSLSDGVAFDAAGNPNMAAATLTRTFDSVLPQITITTSSGASTNSQPFAITITFSEDVVGFGLSDVTLVNATAANFQAISGALYTLEVSPAAEGTVSVSVQAGVAADPAGNPNLASSTLPIIYDVTRPTLSISSTESSPTNMSPIPISLTFSESVSGFDGTDIQVTNGNISSFSGTGASYAALITPSSNGALNISVASGRATDAAGNVNTASGPFVISFDSTRPAAVLSLDASDPTRFAPLSATLTFSESISGIELSDFAPVNCTLSNLAGSGSVYTFDVQPVSEGIMAVTLEENTVVDAAGNLNTDSNTVSTVYDIQRPLVSISPGGPTPTNASSIPFLVSFTEQVVGFSASDITVVNGAVTSVLSSNGSVYTVQITPGSDGQVSVSLADGVAFDLAGNPSQPSNEAAIQYDGTAPTLAISTSANSPTNAVVFAVEFAFSEDVLEFAASDVVVANGSLSGFSGTGDYYQASIQPTGDGVVTVSVTSGIASDAAGNVNLTASPLLVTYDGSAPIPQFSKAFGASTNLALVPIALTFNESVSGLELSDITVTNGVAVSVAATGASYSVTIDPTSEGEVSVDFVGSRVVDNAGNPNSASNTLRFVYDVTPPTVTLSSGAPSITNSVPIPITINVSEPIQGLSPQDFVISNGSATNLTGGGLAYAVSVVPAQDGAVSVYLPAEAFTDLAGNVSSQSEVVSRTYDSVAPAAPLILSPVEQSVVKSSSFLVTGTTEAGASIEVSNQSRVLCTITSDSHGAWTCGVNELGEGRHRIKAKAIDTAGNVSAFSAEVNIVVDAIPLTVPVLAASISTITSDTTPVVNGMAAPDNVVRVRGPGYTLCTTQANSGGAWSCELLELPTGVHTLFAWAEDLTDGTTSVDREFRIEIGVLLRGVIIARDMRRSPLADVALSYRTQSAISNSEGEFQIVVPDEAGVVPVASKAGWVIELDNSRQWQVRDTYVYLAAKSLESTSYAIWDGFTNGLVHQMRWFNKSQQAGALRYTVSNSAGDPCDSGVSDTIGYQNDSVVNLTQHSCMATGNWGVVAVNFDGEYDGEYTSWLPGPGNRDVRTMTINQFINPIRGTSYALYDTGTGGLTQGEDNQFTETALFVSNVSERYSTLRVIYRQETGNLSNTLHIGLQPRETQRIVLGNLSQKRAFAGVVEVSPDDATSPYLAVVRRYGYRVARDQRGRATRIGPRFVHSEVARTGLLDLQITRLEYSSASAGLNYLEFGNTSNEAVDIQLIHKGVRPKSKGREARAGRGPVASRTKVDVRLEPKGYLKIPFSQFIKNATEGAVTVRIAEPGVVLASIVTNVYRRGAVATGKLHSLQDLCGSDQYTMLSFYPRMLINIANVNPFPSQVSVECLVDGAVLDGWTGTVMGQESVGYTPGKACVDGGDSLIHVTSDALSGILVDRAVSRTVRGALTVRTRAR